MPLHNEMGLSVFPLVAFLSETIPEALKLSGTHFYKIGSTQGRTDKKSCYYWELLITVLSDKLFHDNVTDVSFIRDSNHVFFGTYGVPNPFNSIFESTIITGNQYL